MKSANLFWGSVIAIIAVGSIGCSNSMRPYSSSSEKGSNGGMSVEDDAMMKAEQAAKDAQSALNEANAAIAEITDDSGNINVGLFRSSSTNNKLLSPLTDKLRAVFDKVYAKVLLVKTNFTKARTALNDALAKVDQSNPANAALVATIMANLAKLDQLEAQFSTTMHSLASKLDLAIAGLQGIIGGVITAIPGWGSIIGLALDYFVMGDVKAFILELKAKLMAL
jgi:hypothetical protein